MLSYIYIGNIYIYVYTYWKPTWPLFDWKRPSWSESGAENWGQTSFFLYTSTFKRVPYMVPKKTSIHHSWGFKWHPLWRFRYIYMLYINIRIYIIYIFFFLSREHLKSIHRKFFLSWQAFMKSSLEGVRGALHDVVLDGASKKHWLLTKCWEETPRKTKGVCPFLAIGKLTSFKKTCIQIFNINTMVCKYFNLNNERKRNTLTKIDVNNLQNMSHQMERPKITCDYVETLKSPDSTHQPCQPEVAPVPHIQCIDATRWSWNLSCHVHSQELDQQLDHRNVPKGPGCCFQKRWGLVYPPWN